MFTSDVDRDLIHSQFMTNSYNEGDASLKRKIWMESATGNASKFETGEASVTTTAKRFRESSVEDAGFGMQAEKSDEEDPNMVRGPVGPEPPLPPRGQPAGTLEV